MNIAALILAAGYSSRMGDFKPLLDVGGLPALARTIAAFSPDTCAVLVVTGHRAAELSPVIAAAGAQELFNPDYPDGMFTSVQTGIARAQELGMDGVLLCPADCALMNRAIVQKVLDAAEARPERPCVAAFAGKKGHPFYIPAHLFDEILHYDGDDGLKGITRRHAGEITRVETMDEGVLLDMDTPAAYAFLKDCHEGRVPPLKTLMAGRRFLLVRHGSTEEGPERRFIGQTDLPLSDVGRAEVQAAADKLAALAPRVAAVYASPLRRAAETGTMLAQTLGVPLLAEPDFREISLGEWDGLPVREVRERFPEAYAARGADIVAYTIPGGESFYELQHRVAEALRSILLRDASPDILIAAHKGVIRCILALASGTSPEPLAPSPQKGEMLLIQL